MENEIKKLIQVYKIKNKRLANLLKLYEETRNEKRMLSNCGRLFNGGR